MPEREPWERQKGESHRAWHAFQTYRDMGAGNRSARKVAEQLAISGALARRWSTDWNWVHRCEQYDHDEDKRFRAQMHRARMETARRHQRIASAGLAKVVQRLQSIDANTLTPSELIRWVDVLTEVERKSVGQDEQADNDAVHAASLLTELVGSLRRGT